MHGDSTRFVETVGMGPEQDGSGHGSLAEYATDPHLTPYFWLAALMAAVAVVVGLVAVFDRL